MFKLHLLRLASRFVRGRVTPRAADEMHSMVRKAPRIYLRQHRNSRLVAPDFNFADVLSRSIIASPSNVEPGHRVIVLHGLDENMRKTTVDFAKAFGRYLPDSSVTYANVLGPFNYKELSEEFDLLIVTYEALGLRNAPSWPEIEGRILNMCTKSRVRIMFPQDDYSFSDRLDHLAVSGNFDFIFSPITEDLPALYPLSTAKGIKILEALTGYFEQSALSTFSKYSKSFEERKVDVGQRVQKLSAKYGFLGWRKAQLLEEFCELALEKSPGLVLDISFENSDMLLGDDWLKFLGDSKFTVSRKGGASIVDSNNLLARALQFLEVKEEDITPEFLKENAAKFKLRFGNFSAISPRLFEAAAAGVCQILEDDIYFDGRLRPWVHYIPLASDYSNVGEIIRFMRDEKAVREMVSRANSFLIESGDFTYEGFISQINVIVRPLMGPEHHIVQGVIDIDFNYLGISSADSTIRNYFQGLARSNYISFRGWLNNGKFRIRGSAKHAKFAERDLVNSWLIGMYGNHPLPESLIHPWVSTNRF